MVCREEFPLKEDGINRCVAFVETALKNHRLNRHDLLRCWANMRGVHHK